MIGLKAMSVTFYITFYCADPVIGVLLTSIVNQAESTLTWPISLDHARFVSVKV